MDAARRRPSRLIRWLTITVVVLAVAAALIIQFVLPLLPS
jgi:type IV secretory pathway component VirB8